jgi:hypothetical protein
MVVLATLVIANVAQAQRRGGRGGTNLISVAANEAVQKEIGIATEQAEKINELNEAYRQARREQRESSGVSIQDLPEEEQLKARQDQQQASAKLQAEYEPKLGEILSEEQLKRVKEIRAQATGLADSAVRKEVGVTEEQEEALAAIRQDFAAKTRELFQGGGGGGGREAFQQLRQEQEEASVNILTDEQKLKYAALRGEQFDVALLRRQRRQ